MPGLNLVVVKFNLVCSVSFREDHAYIKIMSVRCQNDMLMLFQMIPESVCIEIILVPQLPEFFDIVYRKLFVNHNLKLQDV